MSLKRISRLLRLLTMVQSGSQNKPEALVEGLNVSRRTFFRDVRALQEAGIPCFFDHSTGRYRVNDTFYMPSPNLTEQEAFILLLLLHTAREFFDVPFSQDILRAALKIENNFSPRLKKYCRQRLKHISVWPVCAKPTESIDEKFAKIQKAIQNRYILSVSYYCKIKHKLITCNISPLHLVYTKSWHVIGKVNGSGNIWCIKLDTIEKLEATGKCFLDDEEFDPIEYIGRAWSALPEGVLYNVKLRFSPDVAREVAAIQWHSSQYTSMQEDGSVILEFRVDGLNEITWWIVSYGDKVKVLAPKVLQQKIRKIASGMVKQNEYLNCREEHSDLLSQGAR